MYIITKHNRQGRQIGFVRQQGDYRKAAKFSCYRSAMHVAKHLNREDDDTIYAVDLALGHDCGGLFTDERIVHA